MPKPTDDQRHNAIGCLQAGANQGDVDDIWGFAEQLLTGFGCATVTGSTRDRPRSGRPSATTPAEDRYFRLMHLRDIFRTATSTTSQIPGLR